MGASASACPPLSLSPCAVAEGSSCNKQLTKTTKFGGEQKALRLLLNNNEIIADSFENFLRDTKAEKILFVKYFAELERLKAICLKESEYSFVNDLVIRDMVLNNSAKIYLLFHPSKLLNKKQIELRYEGLIAQCLSPLLSHTAALPVPSFGKTCYEMLTHCQSSLLVYLIEELRVIVKSQQYFLSLFEIALSNNAALRNVCQKILWNIQSADCPTYTKNVNNDIIHTTTAASAAIIAAAEYDDEDSSNDNDDDCTIIGGNLAWSAIAI